MANNIHGKNTLVMVEGYDLSTYCDDASVDRLNALVETPTFGSAYMSRIPGVIDAKASVGGFWDGTVTVGIDPRADAALDGSQTDMLISLGNTVGTTPSTLVRTLFGTSRETAYKTKSSASQAVKFTLDWESDGNGMYPGVLIHTGAESTTGSAQNGTVVQIASGTVTSNNHGVAGVLQVLATTAASFIGVIQGSPDNITYTSYITFTNTAVVSGEVVTATTDVSTVQYWRPRWTGSISSSVTFAMAVARW